MSKPNSAWTLSSSDEEDEKSLISNKKCYSPAVIKQRIENKKKLQTLEEDKYNIKPILEFSSPAKSTTHGIKNRNALGGNSKNKTGIEIRSNKTKPLCSYGDKCYRKNQQHQEEFAHTSKRKSDESTGKSSCSVIKKVKQNKYQMNLTELNRSFDAKYIWELSAPHYFMLTTVTGIPAKYNRILRQSEDSLMAPNSLGLRDILSSSFGEIVETAQFNYCIDVDWMMEQYPDCIKTKPILLVHGEQRANNIKLVNDAKPYPNITLCRVDLPPFGTHHTKMMLILYTTGLRVVILTANLVSQDWAQKTQGMWVSPVFPKLDKKMVCPSGEDSNTTNFKEDLVMYLVAYKKKQLENWIELIKMHDMSSANVILIGSVPGM